MFGEFGLVSQLGSADYAAASEVSREAGRLVEAREGNVAECPARVDDDGRALWVDKAAAVRPQE